MKHINAKCPLALLALCVTVLCISLLGCPLPQNGPTPTDDGTVDTETPDSTQRVDVYIYAPDTYTPEGAPILQVVKMSTNEVVHTRTFEVDSTVLPEVEGTHRWKSFVNLKGVNGQQSLRMVFKNAAGKRALDISGFAEPWWRTITSTSSGPWETIDQATGIQKYVESIHAWEGDTHGKSIPVNVQVREALAGGSTKTVDKFSWIFSLAHKVRDGYSYGSSVGPDAIHVGSDLLGEPSPSFFVLPQDGLFALDDKIAFLASKDFFWSSNSVPALTDAAFRDASSIEAGTYKLGRNHEIVMSFVTSASGTFLATDAVTTVRLATIDSYKVPTPGLGSFYRNSLVSDPVHPSPNLGYGTNQYTLDPASGMYFLVNSFFYNVAAVDDYHFGPQVGSGSMILDVAAQVNLPLTADFDASLLTWPTDSTSVASYAIFMTGASTLQSKVFAIRRGTTAPYTYGLVRIDEVTMMSDERIAAVMAAFEAQTSARRQTGANMVEDDGSLFRGESPVVEIDTPDGPVPQRTIRH